MASIRKSLKSLLYISGWKTNRKIVVIESDDWGSIRMPSRMSFERLEKYGLDLRSHDAERFNLYDTLETKRDIEALFSILTKYKDGYGNYPVFTPLTIMANPDFVRIANSDFSEYSYEPFPVTYQRYYGSDNALTLWEEGIRNKIFVPQIHGREHLNVASWMNALYQGDLHARLAFEEGFFGYYPDQRKFPGRDYQAAFLLNEPDELDKQMEILTDSVTLFHKLFGYTPEYFVPPNGPFNNKLNSILAKNGVKYRYTNRIQNETLGHGKHRKIIHWLGKKDNHGITYMLRNCSFEPSIEGVDWVSNCMLNLKICFKWGKPAVISSHRVNYIGHHNVSNRDKGLKALDVLLESMLKSWPDIEFITTPELGILLNNQNHGE